MTFIIVYCLLTDQFILPDQVKVNLPVYVCSSQNTFFNPQQLMQQIYFKVQQQPLYPSSKTILNGSQTDLNDLIGSISTCQTHDLADKFMLYLFEDQFTVCLLTCSSNQLPGLANFQIRIADHILDSYIIIYKSIYVDRTNTLRYPKSITVDIQPVYFSRKAVLTLQIYDVFNRYIVIDSALLELTCSNNKIYQVPILPYSNTSNLHIAHYYVYDHSIIRQTIILDDQNQYVLSVIVSPIYKRMWPILIIFFLLIFTYYVLFTQRGKVISKFSINVQVKLLKYFFFQNMESLLFEAKTHYTENKIFAHNQDYRKNDVIVINKTNIPDLECAISESSINQRKNFHDNDINNQLAYLFPQLDTEISQFSDSMELIVPEVFLINSSQDKLPILKHCETISEFTFIDEFDDLADFSGTFDLNNFSGKLTTKFSLSRKINRQESLSEVAEILNISDYQFPVKKLELELELSDEQEIIMPQIPLLNIKPTLQLGRKTKRKTLFMGQFSSESSSDNMVMNLKLKKNESCDYGV